VALFFTHAFNEGQANLLYEMLRRVGDDWRKEWTDYCLDASLTVEDVALKAFAKLDKELQSHHDALVRMRGQMDVLVGKGIEGNVVEMPKFIEDKRVSKSAVPDALIERLSDLERQSARMERQIKTMAKGARTSGLVAKAMSQRLTKRVDRLEGEVRRISEEVE
jgi:uncharacterized protein (UPF0335 family)